jgi:hypothetical protein
MSVHTELIYCVERLRVGTRGIALDKFVLWYLLLLLIYGMTTTAERVYIPVVAFH